MVTPTGGSRRPSGPIIVAIFLIVALAALVILGSVTALQLPRGVTEESDDIWLLYQPVLLISMLIYFGVTAGIIWAVFRYRRTGPEMPRQIHGSSQLEVGWTVIPVLILVGLFIPSFIIMLDLKTPPEDNEIDMTVEVIGHQWWWEFVYCQEGDCSRADNLHVQQLPPNYDDLTPPALVVPTDATVRAIVRSTDVVHSFYWPKSLYKIQAIPGNLNEMHFTVEKEGTYSGQCYQFCGLRHSDMLFVVDARTESDFESWYDQERAAQGLDPDEDYAASLGKE